MRYVVAFFIFLFIVVGGIVSLARISNRNDDTVVNDQNRTQLTEYADQDNTSVRIIDYGPIVGNGEFEGVRMTISARSRTIETLRGYNGQVVDKKTYANNDEAYREFLRAIELHGFDRSIQGNIDNNYEGVCAFEGRTLYQIREGNEVEQETWSGACDNTLESFAGDAASVYNLFISQFDDFDEFTQELRYL